MTSIDSDKKILRAIDFLYSLLSSYKTSIKVLENRLKNPNIGGTIRSSIEEAVASMKVSVENIEHLIKIQEGICVRPVLKNTRISKRN